MDAEECEGSDIVKKVKDKPCEETCAGYKQIGIDACQGRAGKQSNHNEKETDYECSKS